MAGPPAFERHLVLHGVAVKKNGTADDVGEVAGLPVDAVAAWLDALAATGRVIETGGKFVLTPLARVSLEGDYSRFWDGLRGDDPFMAAYHEFEQINVQLKNLITDWQTLEVGGTRVVNDHSNKEHDAKLIDRLGALHERADGVLATLEKSSARFGYYRRGLLAALEKSEDGETEWVSDARRNSYHTLWFELHEDLLRIVGRQRVE